MPLLHACTELDVAVGRSVFVGDSLNDVAAARAAGMRVACVSYGYNHGRDISEANPDAVIDSLDELTALCFGASVRGSENGTAGDIIGAPDRHPAPHRRGHDTMDIQSAIRAVIEGRDLDGAQMTGVMHSIMTGECTPSQVGGFLVGLRMKGETVEENRGRGNGDAPTRDAGRGRQGAPRRYLRHRRGCEGHVQHLDRERDRRGRGRSEGGEARQPLGLRPLGAAPTCWRRPASGSTSPPSGISRGASTRPAWASCSLPPITAR